ncbi:MAG: amino acid adenylation domain-containing protein [Methylococcales bacterium]
MNYQKHNNDDSSQESVDNTNTFPTSFAQQRLWFLDRLLGASSIYNISWAIQLNGELNVSALQQSLNEIIARHDTLRTYFVEQDGEPLQVIMAAMPFECSFIDLSAQPQEHREREVQSIFDAEANKAFDLKQAPLLRALLLKLSAQEHILLITIHHIISDSWSMGIFEEELASLYMAFSKGQASELPELSIQYADYAVWQREWLQGDVLEKQLSYWKTQLANLTILELPTDKPHPKQPSYQGARETIHLSAALTEGLKTLSQRQNVTLFMTLLAAFQVLLHRYSGQDDIVVGSPIAGRNRQDTENLIGFFVNTLALRTDLSGTPSFSQLLDRVGEVCLSAYAHQDIPFEKLVAELQVQRDMSRHPLFQVMFILQPAVLQDVQLTGLTANKLSVTSNSAKFDLTISLLEQADGLTGTIEYSTDLFTADTIKRLAGHFKNLLAAIVEHPETSIAELPLLTAPERQQILVEWNATKTDYPKDKCIHQLFEEQVARTPSAIALVFEDQQLSYQVLNAQANQLAYHLVELGVKPDTLVAICVDRCLNMVVGLLAILKAGGAYVPLDPSYPVDRLITMIEDSNPIALLTQGKLMDLFTDMVKAVPMIDLDVEPSVWVNQPDSNLDCQQFGLTPAHLAYVIYTSGSTGKPKGVMIEHGNMVNFLCTMTKAPGLSCDDILLAVTTISFDIAGLELFLPLINGAKIVLISRMNAADSAALQEIIAQSEITLLQATPATWRLLQHGDWKGSKKLKALCGGEALTVDLSTRLTESVGELWNVYGPTETTVWSTCLLIDDQRPELNPFESIGRPIANTQVYILDENLQPVPVRTSGELYIAGDGVARGYLNRPELTEERFIADPFATEAGARMYKTGDLSRWLPDGTIEFLGRNDFQVKIRGFRIELGDIEAKLAEHPTVLEVAVLAVEDLEGDKRLVAYLVIKDDSKLSVPELRDFLKEKIPVFMIPSAFVFLDALPLTPNGKLNRKALPSPDDYQQVSEDNFVAPRNPVEKSLAELWCNILKVDQVGIHNNFFELGGHSLLAVKLIVDVNKLFNTELPLGAFYQSPTIEELAKIIVSGNQQPSWYSLVPIQTQGSRPPLFAIHTITLVDFPRYIGKEQPLYFLRYGMAGEISDRSVRLPPLKELAAHYINEMQKVQPNGPYYLIGFSFGGIVAYEMACQLATNGHQVNLVGLLDTYLTQEKESLPYHQIITNFLSVGPSKLLERVKSKINDLTIPDKYGTEFWPHFYTEAPDIACGKDYQPEIYKGHHVTLFQGEVLDDSMRFRSIPPEKAWKRLLGDKLDVQEVTGSHFEIFTEPHVKILAEKIMAAIDSTINQQSS